MNPAQPAKAAHDRRFPSQLQEHAVQFYITSFDHDYPGRHPRELKAACQQALDELGLGHGRARLEARARSILLS